MYRLFLLSLLSCTALLLGGCSAQSLSARYEQAADLAREAVMKKQIIESHGFALSVFSKITAPGEDVTVYIEGDGLAWRSRTTPSADPTPTNPVALRLARDDALTEAAANVIYMARPCQYSRGRACDMGHWTSHRFAPVVIAAMNEALDQLVRAHQLESVHLVGFSGGGTVAALMAARRDDVADLRTLAGNLDIRAHSQLHHVSALHGSLNPVDDAARLATIPQIHFIGGQDQNVPLSIYQSYAAALPSAQCVRYQIIAQASHEAGWERAWAEMKKARPLCAAPLP